MPEKSQSRWGRMAPRPALAWRGFLLAGFLDRHGPASMAWEHGETAIKSAFTWERFRCASPLPPFVRQFQISACGRLGLVAPCGKPAGQGDCTSRWYGIPSTRTSIVSSGRGPRRSDSFPFRTLCSINPPVQRCSLPSCYEYWLFGSAVVRSTVQTLAASACRKTERQGGTLTKCGGGKPRSPA